MGLYHDLVAGLRADLMESFHYATILTEAGRAEFLLKTYGEKLAARWEATKESEPAEVVQEIEREPGNDDGTKVLSFLLGHDPTRNQQYAQWLVNRYLKGAMKLEDAEKATEYLTVFDRAKSRLPQRDINAYKGLGDLFDALKPFIEGGVAVSGKEEQSREMRRMHQEDQAKVIWDDPEMKIVIPHTQEASCFFGRNTQWCTAATGSYNYFQTYNNRGPLYILLMKADNKRYQWHFQDKAFMDETDRPMRDPTFTEFVRQHPKVIKAIGEDHFIPWINQIGLNYFSPKTIRSMQARDLVKGVVDRASFETVPEDVRTMPEFIKELVVMRSDVLEWLPEHLYDDPMLVEIVKLHPFAVAHIPPHRMNTQLAEIAAERMSWQALQQNIPQEFWTPKITAKYWTARASSDSKVRLAEIPEQYRTPTVYLQCVARNPGDFDQVPEEILDQAFANDLVKMKPEMAVKLPTRLLSSAVADLVFDRYKNAHGGEKTELFTLFDRIPAERLSDKVISHLMDTGQISWDRIPEQYRHDVDKMAKYLKRDEEKIKSVPLEYFTPELLRKIVDYGTVEHLDPSLLNDEVLVPAIAKGALPEFFYKNLPEEKRTPAVMAAFVAQNVVPVNEMPDNLKTPENVLDRVAGGGRGYSSRDGLKELADVPDQMWTPEFAIALLDRTHKAMHYIPEHLLDEPVLHQYLEKHSDHTRGYGEPDKENEGKKAFSRVDQKHWSPRTTAQAIMKGWIPAKVSSVPEHLVSPEVAVALLIRDPQQWKKLPEALAKSEAVLTKALESRLEVLDAMPPEEVTEPVAYAAVSRWARYVHRHRSAYQHHYKDWEATLNKLDRSKWSKRIWHEAVGHLCDLRDVPAKMRTPEMVRDAIMRDPTNLGIIKDPAGFLDKHKLTIPTNDQQLLQRLEDNGLIISRKGLVNARDLPAEPLASGGTAAEVRQGPKNSRVYVFDRKGKVVARLQTKKGEIEVVSDKKLAQANQAHVLHAANKFLKGNNAGELHHLDIYGGGGYQDFHTEDKVSRSRHQDGELEWSRTEHLTGSRYTAWKDDKPVIRLTSATSQAMYGKGSTHLSSVEILNQREAMQQSKDIFNYLKKNVPSGWAGQSDLESIGIINKNRKGDRALITANKIGTFDGMDVFRGEGEDANRIGIFKDHTLMGHGVIRKDGRIDNIEIHTGRSERPDDSAKKTGPVTKLFAKMEEFFKSKMVKLAKYRPPRSTLPKQSDIDAMTMAQKRALLVQLAQQHHGEAMADRVVDTVAGTEDDKIDGFMKVYLGYAKEAEKEANKAARAALAAA